MGTNARSRSGDGDGGRRRRTDWREAITYNVGVAEAADSSSRATAQPARGAGEQAEQAASRPSLAGARDQWAATKAARKRRRRRRAPLTLEIDASLVLERSSTAAVVPPRVVWLRRA